MTDIEKDIKNKLLLDFYPNTVVISGPVCVGGKEKLRSIPWPLLIKAIEFYIEDRVNKAKLEARIDELDWLPNQKFELHTSGVRHTVFPEIRGYHLDDYNNRIKELKSQKEKL